ncbi:hypothetical protein AOLI_G00321720 [Acnodon oligacanthus]
MKTANRAPASRCSSSVVQMRRYRTGMYPFLFPSVISSLPLPSPTERLNPPSSAGTPSPVERGQVGHEELFGDEWAVTNRISGGLRYGDKWIMMSCIRVSLKGLNQSWLVDILTVSPSSNSLSLTQLELLPSSNSGASPKACLQHENTWHIPNSLPRAREARVASISPLGGQTPVSDV